jgi:hypothetical protein
MDTMKLAALRVNLSFMQLRSSGSIDFAEQDFFIRHSQVLLGSYSDSSKQESDENPILNLPCQWRQTGTCQRRGPRYGPRFSNLIHR